MNFSLPRETIQNVYEALRIRTESHGKLAIMEIGVSEELKRQIASSVEEIEDKASKLPGRVNQEKRDAVAREMFSGMYNDLENLQKNLREARLALEIARIDVEEIRLLMRLDELEAGIASKEH